MNSDKIYISITYVSMLILQIKNRTARYTEGTLT